MQEEYLEELIGFTRVDGTLYVLPRDKEVNGGRLKYRPQMRRKTTHYRGQLLFNGLSNLFNKAMHKSIPLQQLLVYSVTAITLAKRNEMETMKISCSLHYITLLNQFPCTSQLGRIISNKALGLKFLEIQGQNSPPNDFLR